MSADDDAGDVAALGSGAGEEPRGPVARDELGEPLADDRGGRMVARWRARSTARTRGRKRASSAAAAAGSAATTTPTTSRPAASPSVRASVATSVLIFARLPSGAVSPWTQMAPAIR